MKGFCAFFTHIQREPPEGSSVIGYWTLRWATRSLAGRAVIEITTAAEVVPEASCPGLRLKIATALDAPIEVIKNLPATFAAQLTGLSHFLDGVAIEIVVGGQPGVSSRLQTALRACRLPSAG